MSAARDRTVLVVDDSRFVRTTLKHIIAGTIAVREEADGEAAWQALQRDDSIVMVFSDIDMPRLNGYGLIQRIRKSPQARIRELPVVVFSGSDDQKVEMRARLAGASEFISKYGDEADMVARIEGQLRTAQGRRRDAPAAPAHPALTAWRPPYDAALGQRRALAVLCVRMLALDEVEYRLGAGLAKELLNRVEKALAQFSAAPVARVVPATFALLLIAPGPAELVAALRGVQERIASARMTYGGEVVKIQARCGIATAGSAAAVHSLENLLALAQERCA
jgi:two-component system cell cycle response regulator